MSEHRDGGSDLRPTFSLATASSSHLGPDLEPRSMGVTHEVTPPEPPEEHWRWGKDARTERKRIRQARRVPRVKDEKPIRKKIAPAGRRELPPIIAVPVFIAQILMAAGITLATVASIVVSWRDLYEWGINHRYGGYAVAVPLMVDTFIVIGEMSLFILVSLGFTWKEHKRIYLGSAFSFGFGLTLSVYGNVGHLVTADATTRGGFALPPVGAALGLAIGLGVLKLIAAEYDDPDADLLPAAPVAAPAPGPVPEPPAAPVAPHAPAPIVDLGTSILVPPVEHPDKVAHPVAQDGAPAPVAPKVVHRPVNGATRPTPGRGVRSAPEADHAAREHLARLRRDREPFPSDRKLAEKYFNPSGEKGKGNRRAAARVLAEFTKEAT
jgi:hypothetical protein